MNENIYTNPSQCYRLRSGCSLFAMGWNDHHDGCWGWSSWERGYFDPNDREDEDEVTSRETSEWRKRFEAERQFKREKKAQELAKFLQLTEEEKRCFVVERAVDNALEDHRRSRSFHVSPRFAHLPRKKELSNKEQRQEAEKIYLRGEEEDKKRLKKERRKERQRERERSENKWHNSKERLDFLHMSDEDRRQFVAQKAVDAALKEVKQHQCIVNC